MTGLSDGRAVPEDARERISELDAQRARLHDPISIIGMACRFPGGANSPDAFWDMLRNAVDSTRSVPADRWERLPGPDRRGGFLDDVRGFEPELFNISPREAAAMDPQQRLLLETSRLAFEDAGLSLDAMAGSRTGVFLGLCFDDYARLTLDPDDPSGIDAMAALGTNRSIAAGRIAYVFGLHGPVMQIDTSCSSSLVALHLARRSLQAGECDLALVAGVNLILSPLSFLVFEQLRALSTDGRSRAFAADASGYGRGEGCGVLVLRRWSEARTARDAVWALMAGSAIGHDGRSNGLTAPNSLAQERVIRDALADAGTAADQVGYVEAHGTGTPLGDPIEIAALARVYGVERRAAAPLITGSVKTNIGHLEGAAGVASVIKSALMLHHRAIPESLHFSRPNPRINWSAAGVMVAREFSSWISEERRKVGVSGFGMSGTNVHVILEEAPDLQVPPQPEGLLRLFTVSARTDQALAETARRMAARIAQVSPEELGHACASALSGRALHDRRVVVCGSTPHEIADALNDQARQLPQLPIERPRIALIFGTGEQCTKPDAVLAALATAQPLVAQICTGLQAEVGPLSASKAVTGRAEDLCRFGVVLAKVWAALGVRADLVAGIGHGAFPAAYAADRLTVRDAMVRARHDDAMAGQHDGLSQGPSSWRCCLHHHGPDVQEPAPASFDAFLSRLHAFCLEGQTILIVIDPGGALKGTLQKSVAVPGCIVVGGPDPDESDQDALIRAVATVATAGTGIDLRPLDPAGPEMKVRLPGTAFVHRDFWYSAKAGRSSALASETLATTVPMTSSAVFSHLTLQSLIGDLAGILGMSPDQIDPDTSLSVLGLDSLTWVEVQEALQSRYGIGVLQEDIADLSPRTVADRFRSDRESVPEPPKRSDHLRDAAANLPTFNASRHLAGRNEDAILLTGATGFLGAFLLDALLARTDRDVICLVRASDADAGLARIVAAQRRYGLSRETKFDRVVALPGDLTKSRLGLSPATFTAVAQRISVILSDGAEVSYVDSYAAISPSHVGGLLHLLELASEGDVTAFHHVSSIAAFEARSYRGREIDESSRPDDGEGILLPYSQCKWAAERLVWRASAAGLPVMVYRPSLICASSASGAWTPKDMLFRLLGSIVDRRLIPDDLDLWLDFSPVDYVSAAVAALVEHNKVAGRAFHLGHPRPCHWSQLCKLLLELGIAAEPVNYRTWVEQMRRCPTTGIAPLLPFFGHIYPDEQRSYIELCQSNIRPRLSTILTERELAQFGLSCPDIDVSLLRMLLLETGCLS